MKRPALIITTLLIITAALYFLWKINNTPPPTPWELIPNDALAVFEHTAGPSPIDELLAPSIPDSIRKALASHGFLVSAHVLGKNHGALAFYLPDRTVFDKLLAQPTARKRYFEGFDIIDATLNGKTFSCVMIEPVCVWSTSSVVIEDIIRWARRSDRKPDEGSPFQPSSTATLHVNLTATKSLADLFSPDARFPQPFGSNASVDVRREGKTIQLSGHIADSPAAPAWLSHFSSQRPVPLTLHRVVPGNAGVLINFGISDFKLWRESWADSTYAGSMRQLKKDFAFDVRNFDSGIGDELGIVFGGSVEGRLLIVKTRSSSLVDELQKLQLPGQPAEAYADHTIHHVAPSAAEYLFHPLPVTAMPYFVAADGFIIFSERLEDAESALDGIASDNTWGKSAEWNKFLAAVQASSVGIVIDGATAWPAMRKLLYPSWQHFFDSTRISGIRKGSIQLSRLENGFDVIGVIVPEAGPALNRTPQKEKYVETQLPHKITSPMTVVRNHNNNAAELVGQDADNNLLLLDARLKKLFAVPIGDRIISPICQIDFYKNKKLQFFFATSKSIWLVDRLGKTVDGFPRSLDTDIEQITVADPDNSKSYRIFVLDSRGHILKFDKQGKPDAAWHSPEPGELAGAPELTRYNNQEILVAMTQHGQVHAYDRSGAELKGFPVDLKLLPEGGWHVSKSSESTSVFALSTEGNFVRVTLAGRNLSSLGLIKSASDSRFSLVTGVGNEDCLIGRIDRQKISCLDENGDVRFELDNPGSEEMRFSWFEVARGKKVLAFFDPHQDFCYFFRESGQPIFQQPLETQLPPVVFSDKQGNVYFYVSIDNKIQRYSRTDLN